MSSNSVVKRLRGQKNGWELQDTLLGLTVLNQNAPKIILTNDEAGWVVTYYPDPPYTTREISAIGGDPLDAVRELKKVLTNRIIKGSKEER